MPPDADQQRQIGYLVDMLENARRAVRYAAGKDRTAFDADEMLQDAIIRRLAVVGEAARQVSDATRDQLAEIPWRKVTAMRNILVHDYTG